MNSRKRHNRLLGKLSHLFFPNVCLICGRELLEGETGACLGCLYKLPRTDHFIDPDNPVEQLMAGRIPFERIATFCVYSKGGRLQPLIHALKYRHREDVGVMLGRLFGQDMAGSDFLRSIDLLVPVPLHPKRLKSRGYNQAEAIAIGLSQATSLPISTGNLVRVVNNPSQTQQTRTQRWENVKGIFDVTDPNAFSDKHLLLVDDVITTGSTLEACGAALLECNRLRISVATLGAGF